MTGESKLWDGTRPNVFNLHDARDHLYMSEALQGLVLTLFPPVSNPNTIVSSTAPAFKQFQASPSSS